MQQAATTSRVTLGRNHPSLMFHKVSVDLVNMMITACSYLALAGAAWVLLRLLQACFWLPRHFKKQNNVQKLLQEKVDRYEKYLAECEANDKLAGVNYNLDTIDDDATTSGAYQSSDKWRKQRESLEMLKRELSRVRDGVNVSDWDYLLEESQEDAIKFENGDEDKTEKEIEATNTAKTNQEKSNDRVEESEEVDGKKDK